MALFKDIFPPRVFLILFMAAVMTLSGNPACASERIHNTWIEVKGGAWSPSPEILAAIQRNIKTYVTARPRGPETPFRDWKTYTFQYQGQKTETKPQGGFFSWLGLFQDQKPKLPEKIFVYINAFCKTYDEYYYENKRKNLDRYFEFALDGGSCYFSLKYDPQTKEFYDLGINGEA